MPNLCIIRSLSQLAQLNSLRFHCAAAYILDRQDNCHVRTDALLVETTDHHGQELEDWIRTAKKLTKSSCLVVGMIPAQILQDARGRNGLSMSLGVVSLGVPYGKQ